MSARKDAYNDGSSSRPMLHNIFAITCRAPEILVLVLLSTAGAMWSVHAGPFPGTIALARWPVAGTLLVPIAWLSIYLGLALVVLRRRKLDPRRRLRRLALALLLLVLVCAPLALIETLTIARLHYLKPLCLFAAGTFVFGALFMRDAAALRHETKAGAAAASVRATLVSMVVAAFAVAAVDALLHIGGYWETKYQLGRAAFVVNTVILGALYLLLFSWLARLRAAILVGTTLFVALGFANLAKMKYMHAAVQPLDVLYISEFLPQFGATFGLFTQAVLAASCVLVLAGLALAWRRSARKAVSWRSRALVGGIALIVLTIAISSQSRAPIRRALTAINIELAGWDSVRSARRNGVLLEFLALVPNAFVDVPARYSATTVAEAVGKYLRLDSVDGSAGRNDVTLVIYMIESLMDPNDLRLPFTAEPVPTLRSLAATHSSGYAVVPGRFGESASSEFEVLTGMSSSFLPARSVAYKQYVKHSLPALPCLLRDRGYRTAAIQADPRDFYNRTEVYRHLCFDEVAWLDEDPSVPRAINDRAPADDAMVDAVIAAASGPGPAFVFAFTSSTHHPYDTGLYADSALDLAEPQSTTARAELKYYINTLRVADAAVKKLVEHFAGVERPVVIAIVGDHLPPLSSAALEGFYSRLEGTPPLDRLLAERRVPLVVWSNLGAVREDLALSLNLLGPYLLEQAGLMPAGFLSFVGELGERLTMISRGLLGRASMHWSPDAAPPEYIELLEDYRLLQHDVLFGERFLSTALKAAEAMPTDPTAVLELGNETSVPAE